MESQDPRIVVPGSLVETDISEALMPQSSPWRWRQ